MSDIKPAKSPALLRETILHRSMPEPNTGCWLWLGFLNDKGYGGACGGIGKLSAHRASFYAFTGIHPGTDFVLHRCDTPACVNPDHLFLGTQGDNMRDMHAKGRGLAGERHGRHLLSAADVVSIREMYRSGVFQTSLARAFGVSRATVGHLCSGRNWRHIPPTHSK